MLKQALQNRFSFYALVFLAAFFAVLLTTSVAASAAEIIQIYPDEGYVESAHTSLMAVNDKYMVFYDKDNSRLVIEGENAAKLAVNSDPAGIWLAGSRLLAAFSDGGAYAFRSADLSVQSPALENAELPTPANISYITSDGNRIFAKSSAFLSVYDENLTALATNLTDDSITGNFLFAGDAQNIYVFSEIYGKRVFNVYNYIDKTAASYRYSFAPKRVAAGEFIFASDDGSVKCVSKADGSVAFDTKIEVSDSDLFTAYGRQLYVIKQEGSVDEYKMNETSDAMIFVKTLSMRGSGPNKLDSPSDVAFFEGKMGVADTNNRRIVIENKTSVSLDEKPIALTAGPRGFIAASEHSVFAITDGVSERLCSVADGVIRDIIFTENLYVLTDDGVYLLFGGKLKPINNFTGGLALSARENGRYLYVLTQNSVMTFDSDGRAVFGLRSGNFTGVCDFDIDYEGNFYMLYVDGRLEVMKNDMTGLTPLRSYVTEKGGAVLSPNSITLNGSEACFAMEECFVAKLEVSASTEESYTPPPAPALPDSPDISFRTPSQSGCYFTQCPAITDTYIPVDADEVILIFDDVQSGYENFYYCVYDGQTGYVSSSLLSELTPQTIEGNYLAKADIKAYVYPALTAQTVPVSHGTVFKAPNDACGFDSDGWFGLTIDGRTLFVKRSDVTPHADVQPETKPDFGKIKADRIGGTVKVYALPDLSSENVAELTDGVKIEILEEMNGFYRIRTGDVEGYVLISQVKRGGLTTVQIVGIVLAVAAALAGAIVFSVSVYTRKKERQ